jgi:pyridoxal phosphate phosphatase PHOSPHO2
MPQHPAMARGVKATAESATTKTTWFLLSNANTVYIDTILKVRLPQCSLRA